MNKISEVRKLVGENFTDQEIFNALAFCNQNVKKAAKLLNVLRGKR